MNATSDFAPGASRYSQRKKATLLPTTAESNTNGVWGGSAIATPGYRVCLE
jgi:hypothetical protein